MIFINPHYIERKEIYKIHLRYVYTGDLLHTLLLLSQISETKFVITFSPKT